MRRADKLYSMIRECDELKQVHERFIVSPIAASENLAYLDPAGADDDAARDADIARELAALASSGGGLLLLGVESERASPEQPPAPVRLSPIPGGLAERVEALAATAVSPALTRLQLHAIPAEDPQLLAIFVPYSEDAPHQHDFAYWHRPLGVSRRMSDREVRLAMRWARAPRLQLSLEFEESQTYRFGSSGLSDPILLRIGLTNFGHDVALEPEVILTLPKEPAVILEGLPTLIDDISESHLGAQVLRFYGGHDRRVYPEQELNLGVLRFRIHGALIQDASADFMIWQIHARAMPRVVGGIKAAGLFSVSS